PGGCDEHEPDARGARGHTPTLPGVERGFGPGHRENRMHAGGSGMRHPGVMQHPWHRYVAIGDSFTEGIGDPEPRVPGGNRGWADRVAEVLDAHTDDFAYANLAIRGRLLQQILDEQVEPALELRPDLITISAGGNDIIRPGTDPDEVAG